MESRRESLLNFLSGIEEEELINKERKAESLCSTVPQHIPPINPQIMRELAFRVERSAVELDSMVSWLEKEMREMGAHTTSFVDQHCNTVDEVNRVTDSTVKTVYSLMSKASTMQADMTKIEMMSSHLKSINKYLDRLDTTLTSLKPAAQDLLPQ